MIIGRFEWKFYTDFILRLHIDETAVITDDRMSLFNSGMAKIHVFPIKKN